MMRIRRMRGYTLHLTLSALRMTGNGVNQSRAPLRLLRLVVHRKNNTTKAGRQCTYFLYRLWEPEDQSEANGKRKKYIPAVPWCGMKLKVVSIFQLEENIEPTLVRYEISRYIDSTNPCYEHNHVMDSMDRLKINSYMMVVAGRLVVQGHDVFRLPRGTEITVNKDLLNQMGGRYLTLLHVYNSGSDLRRVSLIIAIKLLEMMLLNHGKLATNGSNTTGMYGVRTSLLYIS